MKEAVDGVVFLRFGERHLVVDPVEAAATVGKAVGPTDDPQRQTGCQQSPLKIRTSTGEHDGARYLPAPGPVKDGNETQEDNGASIRCHSCVMV
jgi:hypothetical protein